MINRFWLWLFPAVMLALWPAAARSDSILGTYKTITLDGNLSDWTSSDLMYPDSQIGDGAPDNSTYANIYICNDANYLYVGLALKGSGGGPIANTYTRNFYIDTDMDSDTGFDSGWMTGGYDRLVQYGSGGGVYSVYSFLGSDQTAWSWDYIDLINYSYTDDAIEWRIDLADLGVSGGSQARMEFHVTGVGVTVETWANASEASVGTYTFAIPEPGVLAMAGLGALLVIALRRNRARS